MASLHRTLQRALSPLSLIIIASLILTGFGGKKLVPTEAEKFVAKALATPAYNVQVTTAFRTTVILKVPAMTLTSARDTERTLIESFVAYADENGIKDFGNDSLLFHLRLDTDPDVYMKWRSTTSDMKELLGGTMTVEDFIDRCAKEEMWSEDLG